jgi:hypothetical protein
MRKKCAKVKRSSAATAGAVRVASFSPSRKFKNDWKDDRWDYPSPGQERGSRRLHSTFSPLLILQWTLFSSEVEKFRKFYWKLLS